MYCSFCAVSFTPQATVSGASWFSTQLFYSEAFYNQTVLAETPEQLEEFVVRWMDSYYAISADIVRISTRVSTTLLAVRILRFLTIL